MPDEILVSTDLIAPTCGCCSRHLGARCDSQCSNAADPVSKASLVMDSLEAQADGVTCQVDAAKHKIEKESALVVMPGRQRVPLPCPELPELVLNAIDAVVVSTLWQALLWDPKSMRDAVFVAIHRALHFENPAARCVSSRAGA